MALPPQSLSEHFSGVVTSQMRPFDVVQLIVKQEQLSVLGNVPSLMRHGSKRLHNDVELVQYKPVLLEHPVVPHRQAAGLAVIPLVRSHGGPAAHVLVD
jgi:hypothetical protein